MSVTDPYKVLQVDPDADRDVIEAAYRRLARKHHPDVSGDPDSTQRMIAINEAWEQLRDPVRRAALDRARKRTAGNAAWVAAAAAHARAAGPVPAAGQTGAGPASASPPVTQPANQERPFGSMSDPAYGTSNASGISGMEGWATGRVPIGGFTSGVASRPDGEGAAGPPPGNPSGSVLNFGRFAGWSLGEIARVDLEYLEWLDRMPIGRVYQHEIDGLLRAKGRRSVRGNSEQGRGGPFRRR